MTPQFVWISFQGDGDMDELAASATCDNCGLPIWSRTWGDRKGSRAELRYRVPAPNPSRVVEDPELVWEPWSPAGAFSMPNGLPVEIDRACREAHEAAIAGLPMAAIAMARATIEAAAKHFGYTKGVLKHKLSKMVSDGLLSANIAKSASAVRESGNDAAHGDLAPIASADLGEEAADALHLMNQVLTQLFVDPAVQDRQSLRRESRKGARPPAKG